MVDRPSWSKKTDRLAERSNYIGIPANAKVAFWFGEDIGTEMGSILARYHQERFEHPAGSIDNADVNVSIFYDIPNWAFHNIALNVSKVSSAPYSFKMYSREDWFGKRGAADAILENTDIAVFLWRFDCLAFLESLSDVGFSRLRGSKRCAIVVLVYDHIYQEPKVLKAIGDPFELADAVGASSRRLCRLYDGAAHLPDIAHCLPDGVDLDVFTPAAARDTSAARPLRVGWVGNSEWGITLGKDFKGRWAILEPALELLRGKGLAFSLHVADKAHNHIEREAMPEFYRNLDVLVCCSEFEGTPNPVLEAMATGCAVVSTDVGIVPDIFGPRQMEFLLSERDPGVLAAALERLIREPRTLAELKRENVERRQSLGWGSRWVAWRSLFVEARQNARTRTDVSQAILAFRQRQRSPMAHMRRLIATNTVAYRAYNLAFRYCPGAIRMIKQILFPRAI